MQINLNVRDSAYIARILSQGRGYVITENADFNDDSKIDVRDAAAIARFLAENVKISCEKKEMSFTLISFY